MELTDFFSGLTYSPDNIVENNGTLVLRSSNIKAGEVTDADNVYVDSAVVNCDNVQIGDVIVVVRNGSRSLIGKHGQVKVEMPNTVIGAFMTGLRSPQATYVNTLLDTKQFDLEITKNLGATINQITTGAFKQMTFSVSKNDEEQTAIGTFFRTLDNIIAIYKRKLDELRELKKAYLQQMFPQAGEVVPRVRFKGFTAPWVERKIGDVFTVTRGQVLAATKVSTVKNISNIYPVYSSQTKNNGLLGYFDEYLFDTAITWTTDGANAGTVNYRDGKFFSTNVSGVLISNDGYVNPCVAEAINMIAWKYVSKVGNPKLMNNTMSEITILLPIVDEQIIIGKFLLDLDSQIAMQVQKIELFNNLKTTYLQKMFI